MLARLGAWSLGLAGDFSGWASVICIAAVEAIAELEAAVTKMGCGDD